MADTYLVINPFWYCDGDLCFCLNSSGKSPDQTPASCRINLKAQHHTFDGLFTM